jgi:cysteine synthase A
MIHRGVNATIGRTPLVELRRIGRETGARLLAKLESRNPGGSVKDRIAVAMIEDAERRGTLAPGGVIVEATSGNTGIALAFVAATKGYTLHVTMPERMSKERLALLRYLGARVTLTPGTLMREAVDKAEELRRSTPGAVALDQFKNPANPEAHRETTARELLDDTQGDIDAFVAGVGTGGTITGVGEVLKKRVPGARVVAV